MFTKPSTINICVYKTVTMFTKPISWTHLFTKPSLTKERAGIFTYLGSEATIAPKGPCLKGITITIYSEVAELLQRVAGLLKLFQ